MQVPNLEVWFQRPKDIVRKLQLGDLDLGIVGYDTVSEYGQVDPKSYKCCNLPYNQVPYYYNQFVSSSILSVLLCFFFSLCLIRY